MNTMRLHVKFANRNAAGICLDRLSHGEGLSVIIVRGRVTAHAAEYELELSGRSSLVEKAVWSLWSAARP